jgi:hypothetical protein
LGASSNNFASDRQISGTVSMRTVENRKAGDTLLCIKACLSRATGFAAAQGEEILISLQGYNKVALVRTDKRLLIVKSGFVTGHAFGSGVFQLTYGHVTSAQVTFGQFYGGYFEVSTGGMQATPKSIWAHSKKGPRAQEAPNSIALISEASSQSFPCSMHLHTS